MARARGQITITVVSYETFYRIECFKRSASDNASQYSYAFDDGSTVVLDGDMPIASIGEEGVIYAVCYEGYEQSTKGYMTYRIDGGEQMPYSAGTGIKVESTYDIIEFLWYEDSTMATCYAALRIPVVHSGEDGTSITMKGEVDYFIDTITSSTDVYVLEDATIITNTDTITGGPCNYIKTTAEGSLNEVMAAGDYEWHQADTGDTYTCKDNGHQYTATDSGSTRVWVDNGLVKSPNIRVRNWSEIATGSQLCSYKRDYSKSDELIYLDIVISSNGSYYQCVKSHTRTADESLSDTALWKSATQTDFIATDLLLSDKIYTKVLQAVNARIDNLIVKRLNTLATGGATINIESGLMQVFGSAGNKNIEFGVDSNGYAVLKYYDMNGNLLYNLGPEGIMSQIEVTYAKYTSINLYPTHASTLSDTMSNLINVYSQATYYTWNEGIKKLSSAYNYTAALTDSSPSWQTSHFANNGKIVTAQAGDGVEPTSVLTDGLYFTIYIAPSTTSIESHTLTAAIYSDGKITKGILVYVKQTGIGSSYTITDQHWEGSYANTTIADYMTATGQN